MLLENLTELAHRQPRLEVSVQQDWIALPALPGEAWVGQVHNVVARLAVEGHPPGSESRAEARRGSQPRSELLLAAHYDTVPGSPGAADDGAGVVVLLQALGSLAVGPPPLRPVTFLFSDLEEYGLLGAEAYARAAGLAETALVINLDARGNRGSPLLYQTSGADLDVVRRVKEACPACVGYSFGNALAPWLPNATDFSVLGEPEISGLNFAWVGGGEVYHGAADAVEGIDQETLGQLGSSISALANALARSPELPDRTPPSHRQGQSVFFSLPGLGLQVIPLSVVRVLLLVSVLLLSGITARQWGNRGALFRSLAALAQVIALAVPLGWLVLWVGSRVASAYPQGALVAVVVAASCCAALAAWAGGKAEDRQESVPFRSAGLWLWATVAVAVFLIAPSASYLFVVPLFPTSLLWGTWSLFFTKSTSEPPGAFPGSTALGRGGLVSLAVLLQALLAVLVGLLWAPLVVPAASLLAPSRLLLLAFLLVLPFVGLLAAPLTGLGESSRRLVGTVAVVTAACLLAVFLVSSLSPPTGSSSGESAEPQERETPWVRVRFTGQNAAEPTCLLVSTPWRKWPEMALSSGAISSAATPCPERFRGRSLDQPASAPLSLEVLHRPGGGQKEGSPRTVEVTLSYDETPAFLSVHFPDRQSLQGWAVEPVGNLSLQGEDARGGATVRIVAPPEGGVKMRLRISAGDPSNSPSRHLEIAAAYPVASGDWQLWLLKREL